MLHFYFVKNVTFLIWLDSIIYFTRQSKQVYDRIVRLKNHYIDKEDMNPEPIICSEIIGRE